MRCSTGAWEGLACSTTSLGADLSWLPVGPFAAEILRHEAVFRVVASDAQGVRRSGWAHCPEGKPSELVWEA